MVKTVSLLHEERGGCRLQVQKNDLVFTSFVPNKEPRTSPVSKRPSSNDLSQYRHLVGATATRGRDGGGGTAASSGFASSDGEWVDETDSQQQYGQLYATSSALGECIASK